VNSTVVNLLLTGPSRVGDVGPREGKQQAARHRCGSYGDCLRASCPWDLTHLLSGQETPDFRHGEEWPSPFSLSPCGALFCQNGET